MKRFFSLLTMAIVVGACSQANAGPEPSISFHKGGVSTSSGIDAGSVCSVKNADIQFFVFAQHSAPMGPVIDKAVIALRQGQGIERVANEAYRVLVVKVDQGELVAVKSAPADMTDTAQFPLSHPDLIKLINDRAGPLKGCWEWKENSTKH